MLAALLERLRDMADSGQRHVTGYGCPACRVAKIGIARFSSKGNFIGWTFRLPESQVTTIRCEDRGRDVPREHWRFDRPNPV